MSELRQPKKFAEPMEIPVRVVYLDIEKPVEKTGQLSGQDGKTGQKNRSGIPAILQPWLWNWTWAPEVIYNWLTPTLYLLVGLIVGAATGDWKTGFAWYLGGTVVGFSIRAIIENFKIRNRHGK